MGNICCGEQDVCCGYMLWVYAVGKKGRMLWGTVVYAVGICCGYMLWGTQDVCCGEHRTYAVGHMLWVYAVGICCGLTTYEYIF